MICSPRLQVFDSARPEFSESRVAFAFPVSYSVMQASASGNSGLHPITGMNGRAGSFKTQFSESTAMKLILHLTVLFFVSFGSLYADDKPNIVFFFADDQTTSTLGCYGNQVVKTPNIDELAVRGTRFSNACVSQAICWVSRTTILTGLTGRSYGTPANPEMTRPDAVETLYTDLLRENGYRVCFYGKWHAKMPKEFQR